jgi:uncharacterized protein YbbC (DUF1343 family)
MGFGTLARAVLAALAATAIAGFALPCGLAAQQGRATAMPSQQGKPAKVQLGIDVLALSGFAELAGLRIGLLANAASRDGVGRRSVDVLAKAPGVNLVALFSPEHGLGADREGNIDSGRDAATGLVIHSLYGKSRRPTAAMLAGLDAVVVDIQDVGVRFYTYATTMAYLMEAAAKRRIKVIVLDRPNPIGAAGVRGPMLEPELKSFVAYFPMPVQHAMTLGELAAMFNAENKIGADLSVVKARSYRHDAWFDETGLAWVNPSPNLPSPDAAIVYPGVALIEQTNVSVGRGTATPFMLVGAPWIDGKALAAHLKRRAIPGVAFEPASFTPAADKHAGKLCNGVRIKLTDRSALDAPLMGIELAAALHRLHPETFAIRDMLALLGSRQALAALEVGEDPAAISARWRDGVRAFTQLRAKYLLY